MQSLRSKLLGAFGAVMAIMVLLGVLSLSKLGALNDGTDQIASSGIPSMQVAGDLQGFTNKLCKDDLRYATSTTAADRKDVKADIDEGVTNIEAALTKYEQKLADHADEKAAADAVRTAVATYNGAVKPSMAAADRGDEETAAAILNDGPPDAAYDGVKEAVANFTAVNVKAADADRKDAASTYSSARTLVFVLLIVAALAAAAIALLIARGIVGAMNQLVRAPTASPRATSSRPWTSTARTRSASPPARSAA